MNSEVLPSNGVIQDHGLMDENFANDDEDISVIHSTVTTKTKFCAYAFEKLYGTPPPRIHSWTSVKGKKDNLDLHIYPDGDMIENKGHVSIKFFTRDRSCIEGICIVSLIDSSGNQRFPQTFTIHYPTVSSFVIEKYISRSRLLSEDKELLPNGFLKLMIDLKIIVYYEDQCLMNYVYVKRTKREMGTVKRPIHKLLLDSPLVKRLAEESSFFQAILSTPMEESRTRVMPIRECVSFAYIYYLFTGRNIIEFYWIGSLFSLSFAADKYDIPLVRETCTCFFKLYASIHGMDELFKHANSFKCEVVREFHQRQIMLISKTDFAAEIFVTDRDVSLKQPVRNYKWIYQYSEKNIYKRIVFINLGTKINKSRKRKMDMCHKTDEYDFYK